MNGSIYGIFTQIKFIYILFVISLVSCSHSITIDEKFPKPVGQTYPLTAGLLFNEDFTKYTHHEDQDDRDEWSIHIGSAQKDLFNTVLSYMFSDTVILSDFPENPPKNIDILIVPEILELQFTMPRETSVNIFEVWIKYQINAYNNKGETIADWQVTAYGKTPTAFLKSENSALKEAISVALRDAGATLYTGLNTIPELQNFIVDHQREISIKSSESLMADSVE